MALRPMQGERELQSLNQRRQWLDEESPFAYSEGFLCGEVYSSIWGIRAVSATTMWKGQRTTGEGPFYLRVSRRMTMGAVCPFGALRFQQERKVSP